MEWITSVFESAEFGIAILPASLLLGLLTAFSSSCNIGILAAIAGYAGSRDESFRYRETLLISGSFFIGSILSLSALGMLAGYFGKLMGGGFGRYGTILTGFLIIFFGLVSLDLVPFRLPSIDLSKRKRRPGIFGAAVFGIGVGAASVTCTIACSGPLLPLVLGMAAAHGQAGWGALILAMFALGYSLPLAVLMLGVGLGRLTSVARRMIKPIRKVAGTLLIIVGIWLLTTI